MYQSSEEVLKSVGQEHLLQFFDELVEGEKRALQADVKDVDWIETTAIYKEQVSGLFDGTKLRPGAKIDRGLLQELPPECIEGTTRCSPEKLAHYTSVGRNNIAQGKVAALLLAGGQGTRLGVDYPKGMFDVGINKSLFQLQAGRILDLIKYEGGPAAQGNQVYWYIMTSEATMDRTREFFKEHDFFGLSGSNIVFFEQGTFPCFGFDGKVLLDQKYKLSRAPDGNGGLYEALHRQGILKHMRANRVEYVHVYCVDNILVRVCDPTFLGFCIDRGVDAGAKVVAKVQPNEPVGIICKVGNQFKVIEYSEIPEDVASRRDESTGKLAFNAGNICDHFFKVDFLESVASERKLRYHLAIKKIPHVSLETGQRIKPSEPNGIKLEKFIFDVFEFTHKFAAWDVKREDEFSPLKNADGTEKDNPTTARTALMRAYDLGILSC